MKLKELVEKYGEYEVDSKIITEECEIERIVIDLTKPKPKTVWDLEDGDLHEWIGYSNVNEVASVWLNNRIDQEARDIGNVFLTREEAKQEVERRKVETLLLKYGGRRWYKKSVGNYALKVDDLNRLTINYLTHIQGTIYFDTEKQAEKAIAEIGADRIKKALFEVR